MTKKTIAGLMMLSTVLVSLGGVAFGADLPSKKSPAVAPVADVPAFSWTGCYVGLQAGARLAAIIRWASLLLVARATFGPPAAAVAHR